MIDVTNGAVALIAGEPGSRLRRVRLPRMLARRPQGPLRCHRRGTKYDLTHLNGMELIEGRLVLTELWPGDCRAFSPTNDASRSSSRPGAVPNAESGV